MEFKSFHKEFFNAKFGAFSKVTEREHYDSQITLTGIESKIVQDYFGNKNLLRGNVSSNREMASKTFIHFNSGKNIQLNINFPKTIKPELRLYISKRSGFKPLGGTIWFIFVNLNDKITIGSLTESEWHEIGQEDTFDNDYLSNINSEIKKETKIETAPEGIIKTAEIGSKQVYIRNPKIATYRFQLSGYKCEINPNHRTFISQKTGKPYVEAHHYIPIKFQKQFSVPLDTVENVIALCATCHRAIHYAVIDERLEYINNIYRIRPKIYGLTEKTIAEDYYNCIKL